MRQDEVLIGIYDFGVFPYALGDILTWNVRTAIECDEQQRKAVDLYVCIDAGDPTILYQKDLVDRDNCELFFTEIYTAFATHPRLGAIHIFRSRQDLVEHLRSIATDTVNASVFHGYSEALESRSLALEALRRGENGSGPDNLLLGESALRLYFTKEILSHERINNIFRQNGKIPHLQAALGCGPDVDQFLLEAASGKTVVPFHLRLRQVDLGYGGQPSYIRDSNFLEWYDFLQTANRQFPDVLFVALGRLQEKPLQLLGLQNVVSFRALGMGLGHELTLMLKSDFFIGTSSGFAAFANFTDIPYSITKMTEVSCLAYDIPFGTEQLPFATQNQKLIYEPETSELLLQLLERGLAAETRLARQPKDAGARDKAEENERTQLGLRNPSMTTSRFFIDGNQSSAESVQLLLLSVHEAKERWLAGDVAGASSLIEKIERNFPDLSRTLPQYLLVAGGVAIENDDRRAMIARMALIQPLLIDDGAMSELVVQLKRCLDLAITNSNAADFSYLFPNLKAKLTHANLRIPLPPGSYRQRPTEPPRATPVAKQAEPEAQFAVAARKKGKLSTLLSWSRDRIQNGKLLGRITSRVGLNLPTAYSLAYLIVFLACIRIWIADSTWLYIGNDADFVNWLGIAYLKWAHTFSVTTLNPMQGMGSMLIPINPKFNPGSWIFGTNIGLETKLVASMAFYFLGATISSFFLGRAIGFSKAFSFAASVWLVALFFPPFNFLFGQPGVLATAPLWANILTISNLMLILLIAIGDPERSASRLVYAAGFNIILIGGFSLLIFVCLLSAPFYGAATLSGTIMACAVIVLSSSTVSQAIWRAAAGILPLVIFQALGMFTFFSASKSFTARFATSADGEISLPHLNWPADLAEVTPASIEKWFCGAAMLCGRQPYPGALTGAYWIHAAIIAGGVAAWLYLPRQQLGRIGGWFAILWASVLTFCLLWSVGIISNVSISPIYWVVALQPFWALFSLFAIWFCVQWVATRLIPFAPRLIVVRGAQTAPFILPIAIVLCVPVIAWSYGSLVSKAAPASAYYPVRGAFEVRKSNPMVDVLRHEISLRPGEAFRGSVATILGSKNGTLRKLLNIPPEAPLAPGQYAHFLGTVGNLTGHQRDLLDMWWFDIPTLSEYAQSVSRQLMYYMTTFLNDPDGPIDVDIALPHMANVEVLRAMGARFVIIDKPLLDAGVTLRIKETIAGAELYLYEIKDANLGTFSPVQIEMDSGLAKLREAVNKDPKILANRAFIQSGVEGDFVPASAARMIFEKSGVRVVASSRGTSLLLLPVQFTHCLIPDDPKIQVSRANLLFTLVRFEGSIDTKLRWKFNFWRHSDCRMRDVADMRSLGLLR
jgi:hypothetical protein